MAKKADPPKKFGNMYSLADHPWEKEADGRFVVKSMYKMIPAMRVFNPMKTYKVSLDNKNEYTGLFRYYVYRKETMDSPLIRVYIELKIEEGVLEIPEDSIQEHLQQK